MQRWVLAYSVLLSILSACIASLDQLSDSSQCLAANSQLEKWSPGSYGIKDLVQSNKSRMSKEMRYGMVDSFFEASSHWTEGWLTFVRNKVLMLYIYIYLYIHVSNSRVPAQFGKWTVKFQSDQWSNHSSHMSNPSKWFDPRDHALAARSACCCSCCRTNVGSPVDIKKKRKPAAQTKRSIMIYLFWICLESVLLNHLV